MGYKLWSPCTVPQCGFPGVQLGGCNLGGATANNRRRLRNMAEKCPNVEIPYSTSKNPSSAWQHFWGKQIKNPLVLDSTVWGFVFFNFLAVAPSKLHPREPTLEKKTRRVDPNQFVFSNTYGVQPLVSSLGDR